MEVRDMPDAAASGLDDPGGNPLQDGIWGSTDGGWKNRMKRDESFASVRKVAAEVTVLPSGGQAPGFHADVSSALAEILDDLGQQGIPPFTLNGTPGVEGIHAIPPRSVDPITIAHPIKKVVKVVATIIQSGVGTGWREGQAQAAPAPVPAQQPPGTFAHVKTAIDWNDEDDNNDPLDLASLNPYQGPNVPRVQERFIIAPGGKLVRPDERLIYAHGGDIGNVHHEDLANHFGIPIDYQTGNYPGHSLGQTVSNGTIKMLSLDPSHKPEEVQALLGQHFPEHQVTGLEAGPISNEERTRREVADQTARAQQENNGVMLQGQHPWYERNDPSFADKKRRELEDVRNRGRPYRYYDNPYFNRGGSNREAIYLPWTRETSSVEQDFEVEQVIPPGPHTEEVDYGDSTPLILQHDDPQLLDNAKQTLERQAGLLGTIFGAGGAALGSEFGPPGMIAGSLLGHAVGNAISGGAHALTGGGGAPAPAPAPQELPMESLSSIHAQLAGSLDNHPSTDQGLVDRASGDPEDADPNEVNDGDHDHWQRDQDVNDHGGTDSFAPEVMEALQKAEPALEHYMHSDESGADEPSIQNLLELLDKFHPEIAEIARSGQSDPEMDKILLTSAQGVSGQIGVPGIGGMQPGGQSPAAITQPSVQPQQVNPTTQSTCPHCGARLTAGQGVCPQCNGAVTAQPNMAVDQGGNQIAPAPGTTPLNGQIYGKTASQGPQTVEQIRAVNDYLTQNGRPGELQNIIDNPDQYADVLAQIAGRNSPPTPDPSPPPPQPTPPPQDPSQQGMMMPPANGLPSGMPMTAASDSITPPCPKCGSHTTALISDEGTAQCSNCNHIWKTDFESQGEKTPVQPKASANDADDQSDTTWITNDGQPLVEGQEYWMKSAKYDIPDLVRIESKKPDEIEYTLIGEYNLAHRTALSAEEAQLDGISFETTDDAQNAPALDNLNEEGPNDQMEAPTLAPTTYQAARTAAPPLNEHNFMGPASPEEEALQSANFPTEGRGTPMQNCPGCGRLTRPVLGGCPHCNTPLPGGVQPGQPITDLNQWAEQNVPHTEIQEDPHMKLAGKKYTPMEQREFIDEPGVARNSDKLELEGTHYTEEPNLTDDLFLFGL